MPGGRVQRGHTQHTEGQGVSRWTNTVEAQKAQRAGDHKGGHAGAWGVGGRQGVRVTREEPRKASGSHGKPTRGHGKTQNIR